MINEEQLEKFRADMGGELGTCFYYLWQNCAYMHALFADYKTLFGYAKSRVDLMNTVAPSFFKNIQVSLANEIHLRVCRITDPVKLGKGENLTLQRLTLLTLALSTIGSVLNLVEVGYSGGTTCWESDENASQARQVLFVLREGLLYKKYLREEILSGRMHHSVRQREPI